MVSPLLGLAAVELAEGEIACSCESLDTSTGKSLVQHGWKIGIQAVCLLDMQALYCPAAGSQQSI